MFSGKSQNSGYAGMFCEKPLFETDNLVSSDAKRRAAFSSFLWASFFFFASFSSCNWHRILRPTATPTVCVCVCENSIVCCCLFCPLFFFFVLPSPHAGRERVENATQRDSRRRMTDTRCVAQNESNLEFDAESNDSHEQLSPGAARRACVARALRI